MPGFDEKVLGATKMAFLALIHNTFDRIAKGCPNMNAPTAGTPPT
jgi:hypothetical protein